MKENNIILDKSKAFAVRIIKLYKYLCDDKKEFTLSKQLREVEQALVQM